MKYTNIPCAACGLAFQDTDDVVVCPVCGAPHHRACWLREGRCAYNEQHADGFAWVSPVQPEAPAPRTGEQQEPRMKNGEGLIDCPACGAENYENDLYCMRCGAKLHDEQPRERVYRREDEDPPRRDFNQQEFIDDFNRFGGLDPNSLVDGIPVCEYSDYVGGKTPGRIIRKVSVGERFGRSVSWILPAFFFGPIWFFYRKMKKEGLLISLVLIMLGTGVGLLQLNDAFVSFVQETRALTESMLTGAVSPQDAMEEFYAASDKYQSTVLTGSDAAKLRAANVLQYVMVLGCPLFCGLFGLKLYRKKIRADITAIREKCSDMDGYRAALLREGGTSPGLAVAGVLLVLIAAFCMNYLPTLIALFQY